MIQALTPTPWPDYELIDCGKFEKLERFGKYVIRRPEPQALWSPTLSEKEWESKADATFSKSKSNPESGNWTVKKGVEERWFCRFKRPESKLDLGYKLSLSSFKHVGIFPEQAVNWDFLFEKLSNLKKELPSPPKVLNLFAYTGMASVVSRAAGADVTHLDSIKQVVTWDEKIWKPAPSTAYVGWSKTPSNLCNGKSGVAINTNASFWTRQPTVVDPMAKSGFWKNTFLFCWNPALKSLIHRTESSSSTYIHWAFPPSSPKI